MSVFNHAEYEAAVAEEARVRTELEDLAERVRERAERKGAQDDDGGEGYSVKELNEHLILVGRHSVMTGEHSRLRADLERMQIIKPAPAALVKIRADQPLARYLRGGLKMLSQSELAQQREAAERNQGWGIPGDDNGRIILEPRSAALASDATSGQNLVDTETLPHLVERLQAYGGVRQAAQKWNTTMGNTMKVPRHDESTQKGERLGSQGTQVTTGDMSNVGTTSFEAHTYSSKAINLQMEMIQDTAFDIVGYFYRQCIRRLGRITNDEFTTGTGSDQPTGVVMAAAAGLTAAGTTAITWQELRRLINQVDAAYLDGSEMGMGGSMGEMGNGMTGFMMSRDAELVVHLLADDEHRPLFLPSLSAGAPGTIYGYPYVLNFSMDSVTTGKVPVLFGNFDYFVVRSAMAVQVYNFFDSQTAKTNSMQFLAFCREDSNTIGALNSSSKCEAFAKLTMA